MSRLLADEHANPNTSEADGTTALAWAVHGDDVDTVELLIRFGADVNAANNYGATPLWLACSEGRPALAEKLLQAGANPNAAILSGETPLMAAAGKNLELVELLLAHGAEPNVRETQAGQTALMWAIAERRPDIARLLIEHGADVSTVSRGNFTPLLFAAQMGDLDSAGLLLAKGANVNEASLNYGTPLIVATINAEEDMALFLLDNGAGPNVRDIHGFTALHYAAAADHDRLEKLVKALLSHGADPNSRLENRAGAKNSGADAPFGSTPFFLATGARNIRIMRVLAKGGADPLLTTTKIVQSRPLQSLGGTTPLMMAAGLGQYLNLLEYTEEEEKGALEAAKLAVELGADVNAANEYGWTALHVAAYIGANSIIEFLVEKGAKIDVMDTFGQTPLSIASRVITEKMNLYVGRPRKFRESTVNLLLKLGATPLAASGVRPALIQ